MVVVMYVLSVRPTIEELEGLVARRTSEMKLLEYKAELPGGTDADRKEFLADASSFANADGGHLVFGVSTEAGMPTDICGIGSVDADSEILRLENILRDGLRPRVSGVASTVVSDSDGSAVLVLFVPRSWNAPHMVSYAGSSRFHSRNSAGKYPLDVDEIRSAFLRSADIVDRIRGFRDQRVGLALNDGLPLQFQERHRVMLHIVPFVSMSLGHELDMTAVESRDLPPIRGPGWNSRYNFDGFLTYDSDGSQGARGYVQLFRSSIIEAVTVRLLAQVESRRIISGRAFEEEVIRSARTYLDVLVRLGIASPIVILLSLLHVEGFEMGVDQTALFDDGSPIDRDNLILPEVVLTGPDQDVSVALRPAFDSMWNAAGWSRSLNYDDEGNWITQR